MNRINPMRKRMQVQAVQQTAMRAQNMARQQQAVRQRSALKRRGQQQARAIEIQARRQKLKPFKIVFRPEIGVETMMEQMKVVRGYAKFAQDSLRKMKNFSYDMNMVWYASEMAARLRIPREKLSEAIREHGLEDTYKALNEIKAMSLKLGIENRDIAVRIGRMGILEVHQELAEQYQQAQQMGMVA